MIFKEEKSEKHKIIVDKKGRSKNSIISHAITEVYCEVDSNLYRQPHIIRFADEEFFINRQSPFSKIEKTPNK